MKKIVFSPHIRDTEADLINLWEDIKYEKDRGDHKTLQAG